MKKILITVLAITAFAANASYYQSVCTSADGYTKIANGHSKNFVKLTEYTYGSVYSVDTIDYKRSDLDIKELKNMELDSKTICNRYLYSKKTITYKKLSITKKDGSLFPSSTIGVSKDLKSVEADMLCEFNLNSRGCVTTQN